MKFLFDNLQIVIVVVAVIFTGLQKLWEMKRKAAEEKPWQPSAEDFHPVEDFQPALPPPALPRRVMVPPPLKRFVEAPEPELERQRNMQQRLKAIRDTKAANAPKPTAKGKAKKPAAPMASPSKLRDRLRDRREVRRAIVMREILGPPVGLK